MEEILKHCIGYFFDIIIPIIIGMIYDRYKIINRVMNYSSGEEFSKLVHNLGFDKCKQKEHPPKNRLGILWYSIKTFYK